MTGRKRQLLVDPPGTPGAMLNVVVQPAASQDRDGAAAVLAQAAAPTTRVQQRWAAAAERGGVGAVGHGRRGLDQRDRTTRSGHGRLRGAAPALGGETAPAGGWAAASGCARTMQHIRPPARPGWRWPCVRCYSAGCAHLHKCRTPSERVIQERMKLRVPQTGRSWTREEIYEERLARYSR